MPRNLTPLFLLAALSLTTTLRAESPAIVAIEKQPDALLLTTAPGTLRIQIFSDATLRITYAKTPQLPTLKSLSVLSQPDPATKWTESETPDAILLNTAKIHAKVDRKTSQITFMDAADHVILAESLDGKDISPASNQPTTAPTTQPVPAPIPDPFTNQSRIRQSFILPPDEAIYGLGQHQDGLFNYRGKGIRLLQQNMDIGIPVALSNKGYMLLWDNPAVTDISIGATTPTPARTRGTSPIEPAGENILRWSSEAGQAIDYYFCFGPSPADAMKQYRTLTGQAPMMPDWLFGFWQCKERYRSQDELLAIAKEYRDRKIPIDGIIQDWRYWLDNTWGSHTFDKARYPDPTAMFKSLHDSHFHALISVWPKFDLGTSNFNELQAAGALYPPVIPYVFPAGKGKWYDPFSTAGRSLYWKQISTELFSLGADGWWLDAPEPELSGHWGEFRNYPTAAGPGVEVFNAYPLMHSTGIFQGQRAQTDQQRVVILTRSAYAGQQRNSAISWSGDINSTWQVFKNQIPAGLNFVASGIPYWNTDIGGFNLTPPSRMNPSDPRYRELFTRWFQFGAFCPMFRVHGSAPNGGTGPGKEIWRFGDETAARLLNIINLRYRLQPYIYSTAWQVTSNADTMMRLFVMDFPNDSKVLNIPDQFLFGPSIMVNPVTTQGATSRTVYLPATSGSWFNFWTGKQEQPGTQITADAPIDTLPLFIRPGSILPLGPLVQYVNEKPDAPIELRIYRGADASFTLYEDDGHSYNYEKGQHATIPLTWNDTTQTLTIGQRQGSFPNMIQQHTFNILFVSDNHGTGIAPSEKPDASLTYTGQPLTLKAN